VFSCDAATLEIAPELGAPLDLAVFASNHQDDLRRVREIVDHLEQERFVDVFLDTDDLRDGEDWQGAIDRSLADRLGRRGYLIVFWSRAASESGWVRSVLRETVAGMADSNVNDRVLFALLEDCPLPDLWGAYQEPAVQVYGDAERSVRHRMDDLVVRLYWLIYRNTKEHRSG
jgi:TIR domain